MSAKQLKSSEIPVYIQWSQLEFDYPSLEVRQNALDTKAWIPQVNAPIDVDVAYRGPKGLQIFVSIPRFQEGIPVTFGTVTNRKLNGNPIIAPYPSWSWQNNSEKCPQNRIVSVFRVEIDDCNRLWVLDTGRLGDNQTCPPQLLVFNLYNNELIHHYEIPSNLIEPSSILVTLVVDIEPFRCDNAFVYIADCEAYSIIVYDMYRGLSWRVQDKSMLPDPNYANYTIAGYSFEIMDGILGLALEPYRRNKDRRLFYHAMSSATENFVYTSFLKNRNLFIKDSHSFSAKFHTYKHSRNTQSAAELIDHHGIMYFGLMSDVTLNCWDINTDYELQNFGTVSSNQTNLQFISGIKLKYFWKRNDLWVISSRFQRIASGTLDLKEKNFRILVGSLPNLLEGTKCHRHIYNNL